MCGVGEGNEHVSDETVEIFSDSIYFPDLRCLNVMNTSVSDRGIRAIVQGVCMYHMHIIVFIEMNTCGSYVVCLVYVYDYVLRADEITSVCVYL